jgi:hypothetical protein
LQARYVQPLDFEVWLQLNRQTPIASRLYEYLTFVFGKQKLRRISYVKLAASIPLKELRQVSRMKAQLGPAIQTLKTHKLLKRANWTTGKYGDAILEFEKGDCFRASASPFTGNNEQETLVRTQESLNEKRPTDRTIETYYRLRFGTEHLVSEKERRFIGHFIERHGFERVHSVVPKLVQHMKREFPKGQSILATKNALEQLLARPTTKKKPETRIDELEEDPNDRKQKRLKLEQQWSSLSVDQQATVTAIVKNRLPSSDEASTGFRLMLHHEANRLFFES